MTRSLISPLPHPHGHAEDYEIDTCEREKRLLLLASKAVSAISRMQEQRVILHTISPSKLLLTAGGDVKVRPAYIMYAHCW